MAESIAVPGDAEVWRSAGEPARTQVRESFSLDGVARTWTELLVSG
ncbi:hypothetical protein [Streptomyces brasiliensis]|uniref:Uncharacterized protein n=1 Tax=Streptomyces brasiliensis TaxID=1954 RepID=A0A917P156_9ACTN|nr:hypothetical protein [Streptomyces brasiliensis]GGJ51085.1 hypothetical protein GCM10010121_072460 [Streptomyces brasiliensis]